MTRRWRSASLLGRSASASGVRCAMGWGFAAPFCHLTLRRRRGMQGDMGLDSRRQHGRGLGPFA